MTPSALHDQLADFISIPSVSADAGHAADIVGAAEEPAPAAGSTAAAAAAAEAAKPGAARDPNRVHAELPNAIVIRVQPDEGVTTRFSSKVPGPGLQIRDVTMDFGYSHAFTEASPEAYERLILDVLLGEPPLFPGQRVVELSWRILDPIEEAWSTSGAPEPYHPGGWGPTSAERMLGRSGRAWRMP